MHSDKLKKVIDTAMGRRRADIVLKGGSIVDVYSGKVIRGDVAICGDTIAGIGKYKGEEEIDVSGKYLSPGLVDSHIHIESSYLTPEEFARIIVPCGTTTVISDPHEIVNVCGTEGLRYMIKASKNAALKVKFMVPSCVPATPFENAGAVVTSKDIEKIFEEEDVLGLGEFMNAVGVINNDDECINKIVTAINDGRVIDGHSPGLTGNQLNAYASAHIENDHECMTVEEMEERIMRGMYVIMREGSACHDLKTLIKGLTPENSRRCLLCSDDRQIRTIFEEGHINAHLRFCVSCGISPVDAVRMASLNASECFGLRDIGGIAPGRSADIVVFDSLTGFRPEQVFIDGRLVARDGEYLLPIERYDISGVSSSVNVRDFSVDRLKLKLKDGNVRTIEIDPNGVNTGEGRARVALTGDKDFRYSEAQDIVKVAVVERHKGTGNVAVGLLSGYGIKNGAAAISVAHDSHNIIAAGTSDEDIAAAVQEIIRMKGGMTLVRGGKPAYSIPLPVAGLMTDLDAESFDRELKRIHELAYSDFKINKDIDPFMTLCFMALPVIPDLKITDKGLFDVRKFEFTDINI